MANAIINPWIFYWMATLNSVKMVCSTTAVIFGILTLIQMIEQNKHTMKLYFFWFIISTIFMVFIPGETTMMQMCVASYVTPESVSNAYQIVLDVTNDLLGIVN